MVVTYLKRVIPVPVKRLFKKRELVHLGYMARRLMRRVRYSGAADALRQRIPTYESHVRLGPGSGLSERCKELGFDGREGHHTVYLHRREDIGRVNPSLLDRYPLPFGLKLIKSSEVAPDGTPYYTSDKVGASTTSLTMRAVGSVWEKMRISNVLSLRNVAPRVYDVIRLQSEDETVFAMVVQHIDGPTVTGPPAVEFFERFTAALEAEGISTLGRVAGQRHVDFEPPDYNGNIVSDSTGTYYVDIQNFAILGPESRKQKLAENVREKTHFGGTRQFRPDKYAYQSVPGLELVGKRDSLYRIAKLHGFLSAHQVELDDRTVLDVGCNLGTLLMHAMSRGARWCVGLDTPEIAGVARQYLFDQGCSRFDLVGCDLREPGTLDLLPLRKFDFVFYMSIEQHIGFPEWLDALDLDLLLYEGHQREDVEEITAKIKRWRPTVDVVADTVLQDGDSEPRPLVLVRIGGR